MTLKLVLIPILAAAIHAQPTTPGELKFSMNGAGVAIHTESSAAHSPLSTAGSVVIDNGSPAYRIVLDRDNHPLFAYELDLRKASGNAVHVAIRPARQEGLRALESLKGKIAADVPTIAAVREFPPLRLGDEVHVDIMFNPSTGEKLWDVLRITPETQNPVPTAAKVFTGPQFSWEEFKIYIDGKLVADRTGAWMMGEAIMLRVPARGEYYLALQPPAGFPFQPIGWVDRKILRFDVDGAQVEIAGKSNLLMKSETGTVWVYHVPESRMSKPATEVDISCSGDADRLMHPERQRKD